MKMKTTTTKIILRSAVTFLSIMGAIFLIILVLSFPVIDRLYLRPCHHYPNLTIDCREKQ